MLPTTISDLSDVKPQYQAFYEGSDGVYTITQDLKGPDIDGLKATNQALKNEKSEIRIELDEVKQTLLNLQTQSTEEKLLEREEYKELLSEKEKTFKTQLESATTELDRVKSNLVNDAVSSLAKEIAGDNADLLAPHIAALAYDSSTGSIQYPDGLSREDFIDQFQNDPKFAPLLAKPSASGSGANSSGGSTQHTNEANLEGYFDPNSSTYSPSKQYEIQQETPDVYTKLETKFGLNDPYNPRKYAVAKN